MGTSSVQTLKNNTKRSWSLDDIFKQVEGELAPDTTRTYLEDILAISCCIQRLSNSDSNRFNRSLNSPELPAQVNDLDRQKAENIRKYYKDKLLMLTLQGRELTKYRKDLQKFLHGNPLQVPDSLAGIVYRLPYFYDYDKEIDGIFQSSYFKNNKQDDMNQLNIRNLTFVKKIENHRKHTHSVEYWFTDKLNKVMLDFPISNPLLSLLDEKINKGSLRITSKYVRRRKDLNEFFVCADKWVFA